MDYIADYCLAWLTEYGGDVCRLLFVAGGTLMWPWLVGDDDMPAIRE